MTGRRVIGQEHPLIAGLCAYAICLENEFNGPFTATLLNPSNDRIINGILYVEIYRIGTRVALLNIGTETVGVLHF